MELPPDIAAATATATATADTVRHKGVRKRKWGKWVSEVRLPNSRKRIWLGSYNSPKKAARAFDAASFLLRGPRASLNFPDRAEEIAAHCGRRADTPQQIQVAAASYAYAVSPPAQLPQQVSEPVKESEPAEEFNYIEQLRALTVFPAMDEFGYEWLQQVEAAEQHDFWTENTIWSPGSNSNLWNF